MKLCGYCSGKQVYPCQKQRKTLNINDNLSKAEDEKEWGGGEINGKKEH